jgi:serine protease
VILRRTLALAATAAMLASCDCDCDRPIRQAATVAKGEGAPVPLFTCRDRGGPAIRAANGHPAPVTDDSLSALVAADRAAARADRDAWRGRTFDEFLQASRRECAAHGKFLVNGDVAFSDVKLLREFFDTRVLDAPAPMEAAWTTQQKRALTYCVSSRFGGQHDKAVADMEAATGAWEQAANVDFVHVAAQDASCDSRNAAVLFDVNPVDVDGDYLARAFSPGEPRIDRNVYVDLTALSLDPGQDLQLAGLLRHALGHALGFRHENSRPQSGACFDDAGFEPIASYEQLSVMQYPQCNGGTSWKLLLTDRDKNGAACAYGPASGFSLDPGACTPRPSLPAPSGVAVVRSFQNQSVARGAMLEYAALTAQPGSLVRIAMKPRGARPGDPDLYVRLGQKPVMKPPAFTCRPFLTGADETCEINAGASPNNRVHVLVQGYTAGSYDLDVSFVPLTP